MSLSSKSSFALKNSEKICVRSQFTKFFAVEKNHTLVPSKSLVPNIHDGLLFTNSGMNQFKDIFSGDENYLSKNLKTRKICHYQKCLRYGGTQCDLNKIGKSDQHLSFFEMLGISSFGAYDTKTVLNLVFEFLTREVQIDPSKLQITYFNGSHDVKIKPHLEIKDYWKKMG